MTGRRRLGSILPPARPPQGYVPGAIDNREPVSTPTVQIPVMPDAPVYTPAELISAQPDGPDLTGPLVDWDPSDWDPSEPIPDIGSPDPADRTEWFRLHDGDETDFAAVLNDHPQWLYLLGLPVPEDTKNTSPEAIPPPADAAASGASGLVSTEDEPVQDEPAAEKECAE